jgi:CRISPR-associated endonuclease/helicase Cas3
LLLRKEFDELFDTTPDLTGADLDISRFIRSGDERDLQVFWEELGKDEFPARKRRAQRRELCAVPFLKARDWLCGKETKEKRSPRLRAGMRVWVWDWIDGQWVHATRATLLPGRVVCVAANCGGYDPQRGFDAESKVVVPPIPGLPVAEEVLALDASDDAEDDEQLSAEPWKTIATHSVEVAEQVGKIGTAVKVSEHLRALLGQAATWHDWGKSHPAFQGALRGSERPEREDLAKGPEEAWRAPPDMYRYRNGSESRPGFRHELASVLGLFALLQRYAPRHPALLGPWEDVLKLSGRWEEPNDGAQVPSPLIQQLIATSAEDFDLIAYLVASHHGKVRVALHSTPKDQEYRDRDGRGLPIRGIREGDELPPIPLSADEPVLPGVVLTLSPAAMGLSERTGASWRERTGGVLARYGPCTLAYLEAILRAADVQASRLTTTDTLLKSGVAV